MKYETYGYMVQELYGGEWFDCATETFYSRQEARASKKMLVAASRLRKGEARIIKLIGVVVR